ncbi:Sugar phosphatase YidA|nr:Sugar phosphatase YidA [Candidatus Pantoea persica]
MAIKLVAIDMGGTLLNPQHEITAGVKSVIDRAHKKGVAVVLAAGRPYVGIQRYLMELDLVNEGQYLHQLQRRAGAGRKMVNVWRRSPLASTTISTLSRWRAS